MDNNHINNNDDAVDEHPLEAIMNPGSIAIAGAGNNPMKMGALQALSIIKDGYPGKIYPVHPEESTVFGYKAYYTPKILPVRPELVIFILPARHVVKLLDEFGERGARRAIIITAGFRETGPEGEKLEKQLLEVAGKHGIRFLGPNCMGIINTEISLNVTVAPIGQMIGVLGMVSQSGTYITQTLPYLQKKGIQFSKAISVGNETDLDLTDALEYLGNDRQTRAIALYIEGIKDPDRFLEVARSITPYKPILAQYVGGSDAGARAGSSHTGAMAGPDHLYDGLFKQAGILRVHSVEELYNQGWALATQPLLKGKRVAILTNSGGPGTAMAHTCNRGGLEVPRFSEGLQEKIKEHIPPHGAGGNPVDLTFHLDTTELSTTIPKLIMESGEVDALLIHGLMKTGFLKSIYPHLTDLVGNADEDEFAARFDDDKEEALKLPRKHKMPLILSSFFGREDDYTTAFQDEYYPVLDGPEKAARGMLALHRYNLARKKAAKGPGELPPQSAPATKIIREALDSGKQALDEYNAKRILAAYGVPVCEEEVANTAEEAIEIAGKLGYPVVLKGCSPELTHKTGSGLVHINLENEAAVSWAFSAIIRAAGRGIAVLVSKMIKGEREVMAGMVRYPGFGPCVVFGLGGIYTEALRDNTFRLAPLNKADAADMISDLRSSEMLEKFRGMPAVDKKTLGAILQAVGNIALLHPKINEIDLNPVIISGKYPVVVDALMVFKKEKNS
ncbi:MAG: acetate--CoA ligase family protein [Bacillota bacterium]